MKRHLSLLIIGFCLLNLDSNAQYTILINFTGGNGSWPDNTLIVSGSKLYGTTNMGGMYDDGCIFSVDTNGNGYEDLFDFDGTNGSDPWTTLILSGKKLYGVTVQGAFNNYGCIFSIDTNGHDFKQLFDFNDTTGEGSSTMLTLSGKLLYGTTYIGGVNGHGRIFSIDTDGNGYRDLLDTSVEGKLILSGGKIYGVSSDGLYGYGSIFRSDTNGRGYIDLFNFNDTNGAFCSSLMLSGKTLYGITSGVDTSYKEWIFSIDTSGIGFRERYTFTQAHLYHLGIGPNCPLLISKNILYGMTSYGGAYFQGNIFSVDTNGNEYKDMVDFNGTNGGEPFSSLSISGSTLFGVTTQGGVGNYGIIFKIDTSTIASINNLSFHTTDIKAYPNPSNGVFTLQVKGEEATGNSNIEVYNVLGERVFTYAIPSNQTSNVIDLNLQPNGVYLYRVIAENGNLLGEGKIVIEK